MYYRRKILLALIEKFGGTISATDFQKYLFLLCEKQHNKAYEFVPYKFGCFSFQSYADKRTLTKYGFLDANEKVWTLTNKKESFLCQLKQEDRVLISEVYRKYKSLTGQELIKDVYKNYPYYAINSEIYKKLMSEEEIKRIDNARPQDETPVLFTIGYEGLTLEAYINKLILNNIKLLCDVRKNSLSMKWGFSKKELQSSVENVGIKYIHIPELGIESSKRETLETESDYKKLFLDYEKNTLPNKQQQIKNLIDMFNKYGRIALTCFEANPKMCHRSIVLKAILNTNTNSIQIKNL